MTCKHQLGDPNCTSSPIEMAHMEAQLSAAKKRSGQTTTPDADEYDILDVHRAGAHLVLKVRYPNCSACSYEGEKVMVILNVTEKDVISWRKIDPHFRDATRPVASREAPSPAARFPASPEGWKDAIDYANKKFLPASWTEERK